MNSKQFYTIFVKNLSTSNTLMITKVLQLDKKLHLSECLQGKIEFRDKPDINASQELCSIACILGLR